MRVLVTGGVGFIGSHLVDRFLREGFEVRILDSLDPKVHPCGRPGYVSSHAEFVQGCITDKETFSRALLGVDIVSHQAAYQDYMPDFSRFLHINSVGTALLYELIVQHRLPVQKVIVASSQAVYGEGQYTCNSHGFFLPAPRSQQALKAGDWNVRCPQCREPAKSQLLREEHSNPYNQYAVSKLAEEQIALGLGWLHSIPTVALRYSITQGARQSLYNHYSGICRIFCSRALKGGSLIIYEDGKQSRDFVHVEDVVEANMLVLRNSQADYQAFNVGSGKATTILEYARAVQQAVDKEVGIQIPGVFRRGDNRHSVSSIERLSRLGWAPRHDLASILRDFLVWVESIGGIPPGIPDAFSHMRREGVVCKAVVEG